MEQLHVPHTYTTTSLTEAVHTELCVFSDALTKATGAVAYLKALQKDEQVRSRIYYGQGETSTPIRTYNPKA